MKKTTANPKAQKWPTIVAWGRAMGSYQYYIDQQLDQAEIDNAPWNAIFKRDDQWVTADSIVNPAMDHIKQITKPI